MNLRALKARNCDSGTETVGIKMSSRLLRAFSARELDWLVPGATAQSVTFRAFGAAKLRFDTNSELLGYFRPSALRTRLSSKTIAVDAVLLHFVAENSFGGIE